MNKNKKIIIGILSTVLIVVVLLIVIYKVIEHKVTNRQSFKVEIENITPNTVDTVNNDKKETKYSKEIDNIKLELNIPDGWKYEEIQRSKEDDSYKYALKLYKNNENQYATLYLYNNQFGVCGTERTSRNITLNNGKEATIGYYSENEEWSDISFYNSNRNIAVINHGLVDDEAKDAIEVIKTINVIEDNLKTNN